jgi:hypothetical protein
MKGLFESVDVRKDAKALPPTLADRGQGHCAKQAFPRHGRA